MKDIKELIYAAVEENALKFQEIVNAQLQVRAYDAIEALRPEVGASMFGESSHKKMKDDDEEDEDENEEDEDKDEIKESVREYLNQKGTGKSTEGYDDAGTFDRQTAEKHAAKHGGKVVPDPSGKHLVVLRGNKPMKEAKLDPVGREDSDIDNDGDTDNSDKYLHNRRKKIGQAIKEMSDDERRKEFDRFGKKAAETHGYDYPGDTSKASSSAVKSELKAARKVVAGTAKPYRSPKVNEEVGPSTSRFHVHVDRKDPGNVEKAHHATSGAGNKHFRPGQGLARMDKPGGPHDPTGEHHVIHAPDNVSHATLKKNISEYGAKATIVDTHTGNRETVHPYNAVREEVEQFDETTGAKLRKVVPGLGKFVANRRAEKARAQSRGGGPISDDPSKQSQDDKMRLGYQKQAKKYEKIANEDVNEVAMPKNAADWQAMINHQIKITGHPVATDAQFRAQNCKDTSKIASLEPGQDALQYATAQGGTVKLP